MHELRTGLLMFLAERNNPLALLFEDDVWITKLAYIADVFRLLYDLSIKLQEITGNILNKLKVSRKCFGYDMED